MKKHIIWYLVTEVLTLLGPCKATNCTGTVCNTLNGSPNSNFDMYQKDPGTHSVKSNATIKSVLPYSADSLSVSVYTSSSLPDQCCQIQVFTIEMNKLVERAYIKDIPHLSLSYENQSTSAIIWNYYYLPIEYDGLLSITTISSGNNNYFNSTTLKVSYCKSPFNYTKPGQNWTVIITAISTVNFMDKGECRCNGGEQSMYYANGTKANGEATCGLHAEWTGCQDVECWSAPRDVVAQQLNYTATTTTPFNCKFIEGYPKATQEVFQINNLNISKEYILKSYDHGKNLTCQVSSDFTVGEAKPCLSPPTTILVYYPPENSSLPSYLDIDVNDSSVLKYSVLANPADGFIDVFAEKDQVKDFSGVFKLIRNYTENGGVRHIYEYNISITSAQDYGFYNLCASTNTPFGKDCGKIHIRNAMAVTTFQPDTLSVTTESKNPEGQGVSAPIIIAIVAGAILLIVIVAGVVLCNRRKKASTEDRDKEEKVNELYGSAQYQAPSVENAESIKQDQPNILYGSASGGASGDVVEYTMANPDAGNEDTVVLTTSATKQPCSSNVEIYAQVNKKRGNVNDGYNVGEFHDSEPDDSAATYTVVDKSKKQNRDEVPEVYAVVNKPGTKG